MRVGGGKSGRLEEVCPTVNECLPFAVCPPSDILSAYKKRVTVRSLFFISFSWRIQNVTFEMFVGVVRRANMCWRACLNLKIII